MFFLSAVVWPAIDYDSFRLCFFNQKEMPQIVILSLSLVFGDSFSSFPFLRAPVFVPLKKRENKPKLTIHTDLLAFLIIFWVGRQSVGYRVSKIPSILDRIVKDATVYFLVIFTSHLIVEGFLIFAPVGSFFFFLSSWCPKAH